VPVPAMSGIEGTAEEADAHSRQLAWAAKGA
jgi:hypothetical protein